MRRRPDGREARSATPAIESTNPSTCADAPIKTKWPATILMLPRIGFSGHEIGAPWFDDWPIALPGRSWPACSSSLRTVLHSNEDGSPWCLRRPAPPHLELVCSRRSGRVFKTREFDCRSVLRGSQAFLVILLFVVSGAVFPGPRQTTDRMVHPALDGPPVIAASRLAGWYPMYQIGGGAAWHLKVDGGRGRGIVAARFWGLDPNVSRGAESYNLLVLDLSGNLLHNISLSSSVNAEVMDFDIDRSTGDVYASLRNGTIMRVDPATGQIVKSWTYWSGLTTIAVQAGELFVGTCCQTGSVMRLSSRTGAVVRNYTIAGQGDAISIAVDPAGRWFFVALSAVLVGDLYRVNLTTGQTAGFGPGNDVVLSADGRRVWICGWGSLQWYWLANDTFNGSGVSCPEAPAENPV